MPGRPVLALMAWALSGAGAGCAVAQKTEEPAYRVVGREQDVEWREYGPMVLAVTDVEGERESALKAGFRRVANYIFGDNAGARRLAMTAPVQQGTPGRRLDMTVPVQQAGAADRWQVSFVMPAGETLETLPTPRDPRVRLVQVPPRRVAVLRFSGRSSGARMQEKEQALVTWLEQRGLEPAERPVSAFYNPPWTPWPLRRNEVMVPVR